MSSYLRKFGFVLMVLFGASGVAVLAQPCTSDADCAADGNICTVGVCDLGECAQQLIPDCDGICRSAGFWSTHAGATGNVTRAAIDACDGCLNVCGEIISDTALDSADSALEALCIAPRGDSRLQLARQLATLSLNCCISGFGKRCENDPERAALFASCDTLCTGDDGSNLDECIEMLECLNEGGTLSDDSKRRCRRGTCGDRAVCNDELGLCFTGVPGSSALECSEARGPFNECTLLPPGEQECATGTADSAPETCCGDGVCEGGEDGGNCPEDCVCSSSCVGQDACTGNTGIIGCNSCIGDRACFDNSNDVGEISCIGNFSCDTNSGVVGDGSCDGSIACSLNSGKVGNGSCLGDEACSENVADVGDGSCIGDFVCFDNSGPVGHASCLQDVACNTNSGSIDDGSCDGQRACAVNSGMVGAGSCIGENACLENSADLGDGSCNAASACCANSLPRGDAVCNLGCECADTTLCASCP